MSKTITVGNIIKVSIRITLIILIVLFLNNASFGISEEKNKIEPFKNIKVMEVENKISIVPIIENPIINSFTGITYQIKDILKSEIQKNLVPIRLTIPGINLDISIETVGLTEKGIIDVPRGFANAGWYNQSAIPGTEGTSIIDGHFGFKKNVAAVFNKLEKIKKDDKIIVHFDDGSELTFIAKEFKVYNRNDDSSEILSSSGQKSYLNIVTCHGKWDKKIRNYTERLVLFTEKETN